MGYFSNGTEGMFYQEEYCCTCANSEGDDAPGCAIWDAHLLYSYNECNNPNSILHILIPRDEKGSNLACKLHKEF